MTETPAALLERAAATLEGLARRAPLWPWRIGGNGDLLGYGSTPIVYSGYDFAEVAWADGVFEWVRSMSPAVATPLVELLRDAARRAEKHAPLSPDGSTFQRCALDVARAVLGEHTEDAR